MELSSQFASFFHPKHNDEVVPWITDPYAIGLSVLRDYPAEGSFRPAYTKEGRQDSTALLKVGYRLQDVDTKTQKASLLFSVTKASRYLLKDSNRYRYNFDDDDAPTESSLSESALSRQPINLEDNERFAFLITEKKFWDNKQKKSCTLDEIVDYAYKLHIETISNRFAAVRFRFILWLQTRLAEIFEKVIEWFERSADSSFGKTVSRDARGTKFGVGLFSKYSSSDFKNADLNPINVDDTKSNESTNASIPGTDLKVSRPAAVIASVALLAVFYIHYRYNYDLMGVYSFMSAFENQTIFTVVFIIVVFIMSHVVWTLVSAPFKRLRSQRVNDFIFEFIFLPVWNRLITTRLTILNKRFKFNPSYLM